MARGVEGGGGRGALAPRRQTTHNNGSFFTNPPHQRPLFSTPPQQRLFRHTATIKRPGRPEPISLANYRFEGKLSPPLRSDDKVRVVERRASRGGGGGGRAPEVPFSSWIVPSPSSLTEKPPKPLSPNATHTTPQEGHYVYELGENISSRCE